jgi:hypothetical protein
LLLLSILVVTIKKREFQSADRARKQAGIATGMHGGHFFDFYQCLEFGQKKERSLCRLLFSRLEHVRTVLRGDSAVGESVDLERRPQRNAGFSVNPLRYKPLGHRGF